MSKCEAKTGPKIEYEQTVKKEQNRAKGLEIGPKMFLKNSKPGLMKSLRVHSWKKFLLELERVNLSTLPIFRSWKSGCQLGLKEWKSDKWVKSFILSDPFLKWNAPKRIHYLLWADLKILLSQTLKHSKLKIGTFFRGNLS